MAGDWIKWVKGLERRREVVAMARKLAPTSSPIDSQRLIAADWMVLWAWADDETSDGHVPGITREDIDALVGRPGFALAAEEQKWLRFAGGVTFMNWGTHNGESAKVRARNALSQSRRRRQADDVTELSPSDGDRIVTREEKRREEENKEARAAPRAEGDELDSQIRAFIGSHPRLTYDPGTHSRLRKLAIAVGWEQATEWVNEGVAKGVPFPVGWALGKADGYSSTAKPESPVARAKRIVAGMEKA